MYDRVNKDSLTCRVTLHCVLYDTYLEPALLLKVQTYTGIQVLFRDIHILTYLKPCVTLAYLESLYFQNPKYIQDSAKTIPTYSERCRTLAYLQPKAYSCRFSHIQSYSGIFNNDSYNEIIFLFSNLTLNIFE